jgi:hypothetical protein
MAVAAPSASSNRGIDVIRPTLIGTGVSAAVGLGVGSVLALRSPTATFGPKGGLIFGAVAGAIGGAASGTVTDAVRNWTDSRALGAIAGVGATAAVPLAAGAALGLIIAKSGEPGDWSGVAGLMLGALAASAMVPGAFAGTASETLLD